jgi:hypothetical protein
MNNIRFKLRITCLAGRQANYELRIISIRIYWLVFLLTIIADSGLCQIDSTNSISCVNIRFVVSEKTFPSRWHKKKINAEAESLARSEIENANTALKITLSKYPEKVLCTYLSSIYVLKSMKFYGVPYGGTSYRKTVYITDDEENLTCSYDLLENYFHHEFSSILLHINSCKFKKKRWKQMNPEGFHYGQGGLQAILNNNADMSYDPELNERGFLTRYSEASVEEDFNVYCQNLFNGGEAFWRIVDKYPRVKAKADLATQFYYRINPIFTGSYFRELNKN